VADNKEAGTAMKLLITGGSGFIGTNVIDSLTNSESKLTPQASKT
jgi:dTDP-D-glucose 4,6-dehydratase